MDYLELKNKLLEMTKLGVNFSIEGNGLAVAGQLANLSQQDRHFLKDNKKAIVDYLKTLNVADTPSIPQRDSELPIPLSFGQSRLWFIEQVDQETAQYSMPIVLKVEGHFDIEVANQAISKIIERHQILRTCYAEEAGEAIQIIKDSFEFRFEQTSVTATEPEETKNANL